MRVTSAACDCGMLFITVTLLMMQLQSFSLLFLVLSVVPLGLIGVVAALLLFRQPLGFVAILGILSLLGMIARNGVILIDQIEAVRAEGVAVWNAVIEAATSRFRPIMLTAISTVLGMIPIAPTIFWGPMAYAIMGGLLVATLLTLLFLPALYVAWFRVKEPASAGRERATHVAAANDGFTRFSFGFGAGLKQFLGSRFAIRAEAKWLPILIDPEVGAWACGTVGASGCLVVLTGRLTQQFELSVGPVVRF